MRGGLGDGGSGEGMFWVTRHASSADACGRSSFDDLLATAIEMSR